MANNIIIKGKLIKATRTSKTFKGRTGEPRLYVSLSNATINPEDMERIKSAFANSGDKFTPSWVKDFVGYVNVSSKFTIPCLDGMNEFETDLESFVANNNYHNADCRLSIVVKDGAIYPKAIVIDSEGETFNTFADFE